MTGPQIRALRARYRYTQTDLADILGVQVATLRTWEAGKKDPPRAAVLMLDLLHALLPARLRSAEFKTGRIIPDQRGQ